jgi:hypothetical protein
MRIVIFGSNKSWSIERYYLRHLINLGHEVYLFDTTLYYKVETIFDKLQYRYFPNKLYTKLNEELLIFKNWYSIDVFWVFKGIEIFRDTLLKIKSYNVLLVNYNPDHPFIRTFASSGGRQIVKAIPLYDSHFSYSNNVIKRINDDFKCDVLKLPFAFEDTCINWANITSQK